MSERVELAVVLVTAPGEADAERIARALVDERLAACVNIVPGVKSIYRWEGKVCADPEAMLVVKTRRALVETVAARVKELHGYTLPETVAMSIIGGSETYMAWVVGETREE